MKSKVLTMLLSLVMAFVLWAYVVSVEAPESETTYENVAVVLDGKAVLENRGLMLVGQKNFTVDLTLSGYRTDLKKLNNTNITVLADLSQITSAGTHELSYTISYPGGMQNGNIRPVDQEPMHITVTVAEFATKEVPVVTYPHGIVPPNYNVDRQNIMLDHSMITVSGPKDVISKIEEARVDIDLEGRKQTFTEVYTYSLCDAQGRALDGLEEVTPNVSTIRATVQILKMKEVPLKLHVIAGGGLTEEMIRITYSQPKITISGSEKDLESITEVSLGNVDLSTLTESGTREYTITLPMGINNVSNVTAVNVTITIPEMETRKFTVTNFEALHVPEGMAVNFLTEVLEVELRGPKEMLAQVKQEDIVVVVDFADAQPGSSTYRAIIQVDGVEGVGAVAIYTVNATLTEQEVPEE